jgi:thiamine-phosphate pyrophosphorylase
VLLDQVEGALRGGVDIIQIRERDADGRALTAFLRRCVAMTAGTSARILVNDRLDIAQAAGAHGVHLREDSVPTRAARELVGASTLLGRSIHAPEGAAAAGAVDYLIAGSVFPSASKPGSLARLGLAGLEQVVKRAGPCPVWAVGGVTADRLSEIVVAGAQGMAAIGAFIPACSPSSIANTVQKLTSELRFCFDSLWPLP